MAELGRSFYANEAVALALDLYSISFLSKRYVVNEKGVDNTHVTANCACRTV